jgi:2-methylcitrate dehydratase PrpD
MNTNTEVIARFVAELDYAAIPKEAVERTKRQILDIIGVGLAGSTQPASKIAVNFVEKTGGAPDCTIWGTALLSSAPQAAFANGVFSHALDYDDMMLPGGHPSGVIFPATLAVAETLHSSGRELLVAQLAGYEIMGKLYSSAAARGGWHPTSVFGTFGATAAAGKLLNLDPIKLQMAFGIAASEASGIGANIGTMTKPFHSGHGARNGVVAAMLAADGFSANSNVFDAAFFETFYGDRPANDWRLTMFLGNPYHIITPGIGVKMYPSGYYLHLSFEATLQLVEQHNINSNDISSVEVGVTRPGHFDRSIVRTGLEGKFSHQYHVALAVLDRKATIESFYDERALSPDIQDLMRKVTVKFDPSLPKNPDFRFYPVKICLHDGREVTAEQPLPRSHWRYPLPRSEWIGKFRDNALRVFKEQNVERIIELVDNIEDLSEARLLTKALALHG